MITKRDLWAGMSSAAALTVLPQPVRAAGKVVSVPLSFASNGMPVLEITIGGKGPYRFVIDTGAFAALIREPLAQELGLRTHGTVRTTSLKGKESSYIYTATDMIIGGGFKLAKLDMVGLTAFPIKGTDGVLPAGFLTFLPTQLDYEGKALRYYLDGAEMDLTGFDKVPAFYQADRSGGTEKVYVYVNLDGDKMVCCLDTGCGSTLLASGAFVANKRLWNKFPLIRDMANVGTNGQRVASRYVIASNIDVGGVHVDKMPIALIDPKSMDSLDDAGIDGLLGTPFLRRFTIAFHGKDLYFKPNALFAQISKALPESMMAASVESAPGTTVVPFLYGEQRKIVIPARVAGKPPFSFTLATGDAVSSIKAARAQEVGLTALPSGGFAGSTIEFNGGLRLPKLTLAEAGKGPRDAILGLDMLRAQPCRLDFDANQLTFYSEGAPDLTGFSQIPLVRQTDADGDDRLYVTAKLEGVDTLCLLDTDTQMGILLLSATVQARGLWNKFPDAKDRRLLRNDGKLVKGRYTPMKGFDIGPFHIDAAPVTQTDPAAEPEAGEHSEAVIGMGILHRFNIVLPGDGTLWLKPNGFFAAP